MPTPSLPRQAAAWAALTLTGSVLLGAPAVAAPGDNGDVKVHVVGTAAEAHLNQPKVCEFYLDAFNFDAGQAIDWTIEPQPAQKGSARLEGSLDLPTGTGTTAHLTLPDGQYKLTWVIEGGNGAGKHKVFKVDCPEKPGGGPSGAPGGPGGGHHGGPNGGPPAGGGGLARGEAFTPVAGAAAVGLAAVGGSVWFRLRRRPYGAA
ncbi:hypothetical protein [Streptomyces sp. V3I7]|uniref:hypothetical protein n=1 Tax=Streptomyces sp. V3I7 TaxID=3042278 RepID=UPI00277F2E0B|nr:hypothetical protein [Streptomyces sp. V3I7]MDQ0990023.1 hypothetical protein [Streptomyces sp. V3I7]